MADVGAASLAAKAAAEAIANKLVQEHQDNGTVAGIGGGAQGLMAQPQQQFMPQQQYHVGQQDDLTNKRKFPGENGSVEIGEEGPMRKRFADNVQLNPMQQQQQHPLPAYPAQQIQPQAIAPQASLGGGEVGFIDIPEKLVGKLIGRGGETIQTVEKTTGCKLQVEHNSHSDPRRVSISGNSLAQVENTKKMIQNMIEGGPIVSGGGVGPGGLPHPTVGQPGAGSAGLGGDVRIVVPCQQAMVGRVIGRQGDTIRALQQASQAKIVVNQDFPDGVPREVHISGKADAVERAENMIKDLINGNASSVQSVIIKHGIGETRVMDCLKNMVGKVIGKGGETIKNLQRETGASVQIDQTSQPCKITITGMPGNVEKAIEQLTMVMYAPPGQYPGSQGDALGSMGSSQSFQPNYGYNPQQPYAAYAAQPQGAAAGAPAPVYQQYYQQQPEQYPQYPQQGQMYGQPQYGQPGMQGAPGNQPFQNAAGGYPGPQGGAQGPYGGGMPVATQGMQGPGGMMSQQQPSQNPQQQMVPQTGANPGADNPQAGGMPAGQAAPRQVGVWQELFDPENRPYYYNMVTGVSQWDKPPEMQQGMF